MFKKMLNSIRGLEKQVSKLTDIIISLTNANRKIETVKFAFK